MPTIKNIIIFIVVAGIVVSIYFFYIKSRSSDGDALLSSSVETSPNIAGTSTVNTSETEAIAQDFINLLLSVKSIKLNDAIFSDVAFDSLQDSSITLVPDGNEGRPNPFAPLGVDIGELPADPSRETEEGETAAEAGSVVGTNTDTETASTP